MDWDEDLFALFDDLEQQAEALHDLERAPEIADRSRAEYATVGLASRLMASLDRPVTLDVTGVGPVSGRLRRVTETWCLLRTLGADLPRDWLVVLSAVTTVRGASSRSVPGVAWSPVARLGLGAALRRLADAREPCVVRLRSGERLDLVPVRIGQDFVEAETTAAERVLVAFSSITAVQSRGES